MSLATRDGFGDELVCLGKDEKNLIVLSADLSKATRTTKFLEKFPERFFECGIAECNAIGIASGLSENGFYPVFSSFASFLTGKYDVIRVSACYSDASMLLVGTHSGMAIGKDGVTQMGLEDISLMRSLPNMKVYQPATYNQTRDMLKLIIKQPGPSYLRLGRQPVDEIFTQNSNIELGKLQIVKQCDEPDITIIVSGCVLTDVIKAAEMIEKQKSKKVNIINAHTLKPFDTEGLIKYTKNSELVVTVEDHTIVGGLGSIVSETLSEHSPKRVKRIGLNDVFPESGTPKDLYEKYNLNAKGIFKTITEVI
jgi:transketolase